MLKDKKQPLEEKRMRHEEGLTRVAQVEVEPTNEMFDDGLIVLLVSKRKYHDLYTHKQYHLLRYLHVVKGDDWVVSPDIIDGSLEEVIKFLIGLEI